MKKIFLIIGFLFLTALANAQFNNTQLIINETVTSANDTLVSSVVNIEQYSTVELFVIVGDSVSFEDGFTVFVQGGDTNTYTFTPYTTTDTSLISNLGGSGATEQSGRILRGFTANNIKGGTNFLVRAVRRDYSDGTSCILKVWAILRRD